MIVRCIILIACLAAGGCGKTNSPPKVDAVPIKGTVKQGEKPVSGADVVFISTSSPVAFAGKTNDAGGYELHGAAGASVAGTYKVTVSRRVKPDGTPVPEDEPPASPASLNAVEQMPAEYARLDLTKLTATVAEGGGTFDFALPPSP